MKKRNLIAAGIITVLLLTGCQSGANTTTQENSQSSVTQEQPVTSTQPAAAQTEAADASAQPETADTSAQPEAANDNAQTEAAAPATESAPNNGTQAPAGAKQAAASSYTFDELTALVAAYEEKVATAAPDGTDSSLETFFTLKQEENQIDDALDFYEDDLEAQYRNGSLTRDEYKKQERELERLEDRLDDAEDRLEFTFGIDD